MDDGFEGEDRISQLPRDILLTILFQLEMKEAAKTSILSKTWRYLWTYGIDLDFSYSKLFIERELYCNPPPVQEIKYFNWVNQVIRLHSGQSITNFKLQFAFQQTRLHNVDRWVHFALSKRVKNLELDLSYSMPEYTLKPSLFQTDISFLTCLRLNEVNVAGDLLEYVLSKCHLLECLFVTQSRTLVRLKVVSLKLKVLSIQHCSWLEQFEIDAVNLSYLCYDGHLTIKLLNLPSLAEVNFRGQYCGATVPICQEIAPFARQLSKFSLHIMLDAVSRGYKCFAICNIPARGLPCFSNLKFLELTYWHESIVDNPSIIRLLGACPLLCEFKLQICWDIPIHMPKMARVFKGLEPSSLGWGECNLYMYDHSIEDDKIELKALPCLRVFHFVGFCGGDDDVNLILAILDMATQLHTVTCHPITHHPDSLITENMALVCRLHAKMLESFVAPRVQNYVIVDDYNVFDIL